LVAEAWMNDDMHTSRMYEKIIGTAGDTLCHSHGALEIGQHSIEMGDTIIQHADTMYDISLHFMNLQKPNVHIEQRLGL
jgi:hypothetical protein